MRSSRTLTPDIHGMKARSLTMTQPQNGRHWDTKKAQSKKYPVRATADG